MTYCKECGKSLPAGAKFCGNCGTRVPVRALRATKKPEALPKAPPEAPMIRPLLLLLLLVSAVVVTVVLAVHFRGRGTPPSIVFTVWANASVNNVILTISHEYGDDISIADLKVMGSDSTGAMQTATLSVSSGTFSVGWKIAATYTYGPNPSGKTIKVYVIHDPSKRMMFNSSNVLVH